MAEVTPKMCASRSLICLALLLFPSSSLFYFFFFFFPVMSTASEVVVKPCSGSGNGKVGSCLLEEMEMESERSRRVLWAAAADPQKNYISYEALKGDVVPCTRPGVPYYNCNVLPRASPYSRGCQIISDCRVGSP